MTTPRRRCRAMEAIAATARADGAQALDLGSVDSAQWDLHRLHAIDATRRPPNFNYMSRTLLDSPRGTRPLQAS